MRSKLFVPASRPELFDKALAGAADAISFDLEDAVAIERKAAARDNLKCLLGQELAPDGNLDKAEFAAWMVALKTASDPTTKATDPATQQWVGGAFASADTDKSSAVSQGELTTYLSLGAE